MYASVTIKSVKDWLTDVKQRTSAGNRKLLNTEQFAMVKRVADRVMDEIRAVSKQNFHTIGSLCVGVCMGDRALARRTSLNY
jgi:hypothetical protein